MTVALFGLAVLVVGAGHYYLWRRLVRATTTSPRLRRVGLWVLAGLLALTCAALVGTRALPREVAQALAWPGYVWLGVFFYLLVVLAVLEIPALVVGLALRHAARRGGRALAVPAPALAASERTEPVPDPGPAPVGGLAVPPGSIPDAGADRYRSRRVFLARTVALTAGAAAVGLVGPGLRCALGMPQLRRIQIPLAKLPAGADGVRIALVADIHLGPLNGAGRTARIVDMINGLDADLIAVVGDLVDGSVAELGSAAAPLVKLRSRLGTFFVTGNHEYYSGYQEWIEEVARLGMRPLRNERVELPGGLDLAGVNDVTGRTYGDGPNVEAALAGRDLARPVVLLAHQPVQAHDAARHGVDLQLSGHTHGGQMAPFQLVVRASGQPVVSGLGEVDGMPVYVTNGAGFWGPPVRVGAPPDVTLVLLRTAG